METLTHLKPETQDALAGLVHANMDEVAALEEAAMACESRGLMIHVTDLAKQRIALADELKSALALSGVREAKEGTVLGNLRTLWSKLQHSVLGGDPAKIVDEVIAGEQALEAAYRDALAETRGSPANALLMNHIQRIRREEHLLEELKEALGAE